MNIYQPGPEVTVMIPEKTRRIRDKLPRYLRRPSLTLMIGRRRGEGDLYKSANLVWGISGTVEKRSRSVMSNSNENDHMERG
ncbi:hypothetical protein BDZ94DRAFT_1245242 [Collybia nuda]|uniref:Uncharacterized protein n=1 Tax=Collybia nuda TaxID=64659 RepID=A0A9P5YI36_9AGAR|nr:hypothetical protein BDZ94DRAFT_1245242 [Collybia nuda]